MLITTGRRGADKRTAGEKRELAPVRRKAARRRRRQLGTLIAVEAKQATPDVMTGMLPRSLRNADQKGLRALAAREHTDKDTDIYIYIYLDIRVPPLLA